MKRPYDLIEGQESETVTITVDGQKITAFKGEMLLSTLLAYGRRAISINDHGEISGAYCGMGICHLCMITVNGFTKQRACQLPVTGGMVIETKKNLHFPPGFGIEKE